MQGSVVHSRSSWKTSLLLALVICLVAGASVAVGVLANQSSRLSLLLLIPCALVALVFAVRYFTASVLLFPLVTLLVPMVLPTGTGTSLPMNTLFAMLLVSVWIASMYAARSWKLAPSPLNRPLLVFCGVCAVSLVWSRAWIDPLVRVTPNFIFVQLGALITYILSAGVALLVGNFLRTQAQLKYVVFVFLAVFVVMLCVRLLSIRQTILSVVGLWGPWLIAIACGLATQKIISWYWRLPLLLIVALTLYQTMILDSVWLSGWVPSMAVIIAITLLRSRKLFVALLIAAALLYQPLIGGFVGQVVQENIAEGSDGRVGLWEISLELIHNHWLFGMGPAGYAAYYMTYHPDEAHSTHNNFIDILAQFGVVGMMSWLWLTAVGLWEGWILSRRAPQGFLRTLAIIVTSGWCGAQMSMMFGDWVLPFPYNLTIAAYRHTVYTWVFLGMLICIRGLLPPPTQIQRSQP